MSLNWPTFTWQQLWRSVKAHSLEIGMLMLVIILKSRSYYEKCTLSTKGNPIFSKCWLETWRTCEHKIVTHQRSPVLILHCHITENLTRPVREALGEISLPNNPVGRPLGLLRGGNVYLNFLLHAYCAYLGLSFNASIAWWQPRD